MNRKELLVPVGNMESFYAAIYAGADAVYLSAKKFGARAFSQNFTKEELKYVINYAHIYNVKVYVTVNTLIFEEELPELISYLEFLYLNNVDAVIIQDLGVLNIIKNKFPGLEIHASTQMNTHNNETIQFLISNGVKRVVLAREVSLNQIEAMDNRIEKEIFIHGALCMSYSGQCLLSSVIGGRSGNRGLCAGPCRLPYKLIEKKDNKETTINTFGNYLLSTKDLSTLEYLDEILKSNVTSLKIEGRMKSKEYVYLVTSIYRKAIDNFYEFGKTLITKEDINTLKLLFNREFTKGFLFNENKTLINNSIKPNHHGIEIGKVISQNNNKVKIKLSTNLEKNDGIRILGTKEYGCYVNEIYKNGKLIKEAFKDDIIEIKINEKVKPNSDVVKTVSKKQINLVEKLIQNKKRINIDMQIKGKLDDYLYLTITDGINKVEVKSRIKTFKAINKPLTQERIKQQLSKLNDTPFKLNNLDFSIENNLLIPIKEINDLRRQGIDKLIKERTAKNNSKVINKLPTIKKVTSENKVNINCFVKTESQLLCCIQNKIDNIYVEEELFNKYKNKYDNLILYMPRIITKYKNYKNTKMLIRELGSLNYSKNNLISADYTLNITNSYSIDLLNKNNVKNITLSTELDDSKLINILNKKGTNNNLELIIYGNIEIFISKYCILNKHINKNSTCSVCKNNYQYYLVDRKNEKYQIITDKLCNNIILSSKKVDNLHKLEMYKNLGIKNFRLQFYNESEKEINKLLNKIKTVV